MIEFDGVFYRVDIPICAQQFPVNVPMIMGLHPKFMSIETGCGRTVWQTDAHTRITPVKLF